MQQARSNPDALTILRCRPTGRYCCGDESEHRHLAAKTHVWNGESFDTQGYRAGTLFDVYERNWSSFTQFAELLGKIASDDRSLVIRNQLKPGHPDRGVRRLFHDRESPAPFEQVDRTWICIDVDGAPEDYKIPEWLRGVRHVAQLSSSAGVKNTTSVHLWFLLDRPVGCPSLNDYFKEWKFLDSTVFRPVQAHYTANPAFVGAPDPIGERLSVINEGGPERATPPGEIVGLETHVQREIEREAERRRRLEELRRNRTPSTMPQPAIKTLHRACDEILGATRGNRHATITQKAYFVGGLVGAERLGFGTALSELVSVSERLFESSTRRRDVRRIVEETLRNGMRSPLWE